MGEGISGVRDVCMFGRSWRVRMEDFRVSDVAACTAVMISPSPVDLCKVFHPHSLGLDFIVHV